MIKLRKYHRQKWPRSLKKKYKNYCQKHGLKYSLKTDLDYLYMSVFDYGLKSKEKIELFYESFRFEHEDMWPYMNFKERNFFLQKDMMNLKAGRKSFLYEDTRIYIPFLNPLMNRLYGSETAVLELPQFLKLYDDFTDEIILIEKYGTSPFKANMSSAEYITGNGHEIILYHKMMKTFYRISEKSCESFPIFYKTKPSDKVIVDLADKLLKDNSKFITACFEEDLLSPRARRAFVRRRKKYEYK